MESMLVPYSALRELPAGCVVVLAPHPDDEVFGCGGALIQHVQARCSVSVIVVSDGAYGAQGNRRDQVIAAREAECCAAAALLGYPAPTFWRLPDRGIVYGELMVTRVMGTIAALGADLVYAPALTEMHPDHRSLAMVAVEAVRRLGVGVRLAMYEIGVPLAPNVLLDITAVAERKLEAMRCFGSQLAAQAYDDHIMALNRFRTYTLPAHVKMAEAFQVHSSEDLSPSVLRLFDSEYVRQARLGLPMFGASDVPLISVVVVGQVEKSLHRVLDALSLQTYQNLEIVVVSKKSGTEMPLGSRCGRYPIRGVAADAGSSVVLGQAANAGLRATTGAYIAFLDGESILDPDHFVSLVGLLKSHVELSAIAYSGVRIRTSLGSDGAESWEAVQTTVGPVQLLLGGLPCASVLLVPRVWVGRGVRFDDELDQNAFLDFWLRLSDMAPFAYSGRITATQVRQMRAAELPANRGQRPLEEDNQKFFEKWSQNLNAKKLGEISRAFQSRENYYQEMLEKLQLVENKNARLCSDFENLHHLFSDAQQEIRALRASTCWRWTRPLRFVVEQGIRLKKSFFHTLKQRNG